MKLALVQSDTQKPGPDTDKDDPALPVHDAYELTEGGNLARITLHGKVYTLRITRLGKLILTK